MHGVSIFDPINDYIITLSGDGSEDSTIFNYSNYSFETLTIAQTFSTSHQGSNYVLFILFFRQILFYSK